MDPYNSQDQVCGSTVVMTNHVDIVIDVFNNFAKKRVLSFLHAHSSGAHMYALQPRHACGYNVPPVQKHFWLLMLWANGEREAQVCPAGSLSSNKRKYLWSIFCTVLPYFVYLAFSEGSVMLKSTVLMNLYARIGMGESASRCAVIKLS